MGEDTGGNISLQFTQGLLTLGGIKKYAADEDTGGNIGLSFTQGLLTLGGIGKGIWIILMELSMNFLGRFDS